MTAPEPRSFCLHRYIYTLAMIPRRYEEVEPTPATPLSPRSSTASSDSRFVYDDDFLESPVRSPASVVSVWDEGKRPHSRIRHAVGIALLLATVLLWTASNFLASVSQVPAFACIHGQH